jgi:CHAT domain-containing protein/tetratricopeptide (TPR) repeat protein
LCNVWREMAQPGVPSEDDQRLHAEVHSLVLALNEWPERFAGPESKSQRGNEEIKPVVELALAAEAEILAHDKQAERTVDALVTTLTAISRSRVESGEFQAALVLDQHSLAIKRAQPGSNPLDIASAFRNLARDYFHIGDYASAARFSKEGLSIATGYLGETDCRILRFLDSVAGACEQLGEYELAETHAERALALAESCFGPQDPRVVPALQTLETAYRAVGRLQDAYAAAARALQIHSAASGKTSFMTARALARLAVVTAQIGETTRAVEMFDDALARLRKLPPYRIEGAEIATVLTNLAGLADPDRATSLYEQALDLRRRISGPQHPETVNVLSHLGLLHCQGGELDRALFEWNECLASRRAIFGHIHPDVARTLIDTTFVLHYQGRDVEARRAVLEALAILACYDLPAVTARAHTLLAAIISAESVTAAIMFAKLVVNSLQELRAEAAALGGSFDRAFIAAREQPYRQLGDALIVSGRLPEAQQVMAMLKEVELFEVTLGQTDARLTRAVLTPLEVHWVAQRDSMFGRLRGILVSLRESAQAESTALESRRAGRLALDAAVNELEQWVDSLVPAFKQTEGGARAGEAKTSASEPACRGSIANSTGMLQFLLASDHLRVVVTTSETIDHYDVTVATGEVHHLVYEMRTALQRGTNSYLPHARRLYDLLIAPALQQLRAAGVSTLVVSLDGVLRYLPVAALHDGIQHLVHEFAVVYAAGPLGTDMQKRLPAEVRACGLGVTRAIGSHPALHGVREELAAVIRTTDTGPGVLPGIIQLDDAFTAESLHAALSTPYPVVHISSHFAFRAAQEASSYLLLGDGSRLTLANLANWSFAGVELVVLSACDTATGGGHEQSGREIEGLGALARHQGARLVIATLWPVRDFTTAVLMRRFYEGWQQLGLAPAEALRQAQLSLCTRAQSSSAAGPARAIAEPGDQDDDVRWQHPRYWAPYLLIGEPPGALAGTPIQA